jgi:hypothetical protein
MKKEMNSGTDNPKQKIKMFLIFFFGMLCMAFGDSDFPSQRCCAQEKVKVSLHSLSPHQIAGVGGWPTMFWVAGRRQHEV